MKEPHFKQDNPKDQITAVLASMEGALNNYENGIVTRKAFLAKMDERIKDLYSLRAYMKDQW